MEDVTFYTVCNAEFFLGLVALINSLVLSGHRSKIVVGSYGLTERQKSILHEHDLCHVFDLSKNVAQNPGQLKAFPSITGTDGIAVMIDTGMIITSSLRPMIDKARSGKVCAFANPINRWFPEWERIFDLPSPPRRDTYVCSCFVVIPTKSVPNLMSEWWDACARVHAMPTYQEAGGDFNGPVGQGDQDALNAVLLSKYPSDTVSLENPVKMVYRWEFPETRVIEVDTLDCRFRGGRPAILHAALTPKPWEPKGQANDIYHRFLRRLLTRPDVYISLPLDMLPASLRTGVRARLVRERAFLANMSLSGYVLSHSPYLVAQAARRFRSVARHVTSRARQHSRH